MRVFKVVALLAAFQLPWIFFPVRAEAQVVPLGSEFQVNTFTTDGQYYASVAADADGDFIVVWTSQDQDGSFSGVFGQRYASTGTPLGTASSE